jgi:hypothetical protein
MKLWDAVKRTGQREAQAFVLKELPGAGDGRAVVPETDYVRVWLCEMFLANQSTLLANWLPAAHVNVSLAQEGQPAMEFSRVLRPNLKNKAGGSVLLNYPITDLLPFNGGVLEVEAALVGLQTGTRLDVVVDLLQAVSQLPLPGLDQAISIAHQVSSTTKSFVEGTNGAVHIDVHQGWSSSPADKPAVGNTLRDSYVAALLATDQQVDPGSLRVVDSRLHHAGSDGSTSHLLGWDFLLLRVEVCDKRDDFWLPELQEQLNRAIEALNDGTPDLAERYRTAAIAMVWKSPAFTWTDRDRIVGAVHARFDAVASSGHGAAGVSGPEGLTELVNSYGPTVDEVRAKGPLTPELAFAGMR